jgi:non-ribosomal peptide synthetase component E (peptide arylation enzyme)
MSVRDLKPALVADWKARGIWHDLAMYEVIDAHARNVPDRLAVADQHQRLTYSELVARSSSLARWLRGLGLADGDVVSLQGSNSIAFALCHLACNRADLTFVPMSHVWREREIVHLLRTARAKVAFVPDAETDYDHYERLSARRNDLPDLVHLAELSGDRGRAASFDEVSTDDDRGHAAWPCDPDDSRFVMVTSGTTDLPRMSGWTDNNLWFFLSQYADAIGIASGDVAVGLAPANTGATGYVYPVVTPLLNAASSVLLEHWSPAAALDLIASERADLATAVPTQVIKMLQDPAVGNHDYPSLRVFTNAGSALPPDVAAGVERTFGCTVQAVYGSTDGGVPVMTRVTDPPVKRYSTVGKLLPETDLRLVDAELNDVPVGDAGEIIFRGPTKTLGYLNDPQRTAETFIDDGWYRSGDLGRLDDDGYLSIVGRVKDVIIRGGQNLSPREIEDLIVTHPAVAEVGVIGIPDAVYGERACACVALRAGHEIELAELNEFLESQDIAKYKLPEHLELFDELPKSAGGKISKVELRHEIIRRMTPTTQ